MRFCSTRLRARLSRISPQTRSSEASNASPVQRMAVGNRGTKPGLDVGRHKRQGECGRCQGGKRRRHTEEHERPGLLQQVQQRTQDSYTVADGPELGSGPNLTRTVGQGELCRRQLELRGVDGHFRLDFEARGQGGKAFDEAARKGAVAGEDVAELGSKQSAIEAVEETIAGGMTLAVRFTDDVFACPHGHVVAAVHHEVDEQGGGCGVVGAVAVRHQIDVRVDVGEHPSDDIALAFAGLVTDFRTGASGLLGCSIRRGVVEDDDPGVWQGAPKREHHVGDARGLVVARQEDGDASRSGRRQGCRARALLLEMLGERILQIQGGEGSAHAGPAVTTRCATSAVTVPSKLAGKG